MEEKWKDTKYPNYEVSNFGRVRNKDAKQILRKTYNIVVINGRFRNVAVMVLEAFKNVSMHNRKVYYKDDDDSNCALSNLSYKPFKKKKEKRPIVQLTVDGRYITTYQSGHEAAIAIGKPNLKSNIILVCRGKRKQCGGFKWMFKDDYMNEK